MPQSTLRRSPMRRRSGACQIRVGERREGLRPGGRRISILRAACVVSTPASHVRLAASLRCARAKNIWGAGVARRHDPFEAYGRGENRRLAGCAARARNTSQRWEKFGGHQATQPDAMVRLVRKTATDERRGCGQGLISFAGGKSAKGRFVGRLRNPRPSGVLGACLARTKRMSFLGTPAWRRHWQKDQCAGCQIAVPYLT
ncbi:hypothetical protein BD413DRAFT_117035 [Trametes elegans]|nr:hypothetical protein BD413DRAFT_117035 [Trametes elegans]